MADQGASKNPAVGSPCVRNCCLDNADICLGCGRSLDEIVGWRGFDVETQKAVLQRSQERQSQRKQP